MGDLVAMSRAKPQPARGFAIGHSAEILFFTGVRYYRLNEHDLPASIAPPSRTPRPTAKRRAAKVLRASPRHEALA